MLSTLRGTTRSVTERNKYEKKRQNKTPSFGQAPQCPLESLNEGWVDGARYADSLAQIFFIKKK
jgi:hypothetical protein